MKILVTGGAGFIASHVAEAYLDAGHEVVIIDDLSAGDERNIPAGARFEKLDVRSEAASRLIEEEKPEVINHHAAQMSVSRSVADPVFDADVNVVGLLKILAAALRAGTKRVVFATSGGTVYGDPHRLPAKEEQATVPLSPYGIAKLAGEHYLQHFSAVHGLHHLALRYANVYGPRQDPHGEAGVVAIFSKKMLSGAEATIFGDGRQTRDYVFVQDVVRANLAALESDFCGAVNIGTGVETDVLRLHALLSEICGSEQAPRMAPARPGEVRRIALDYSLAAEVLGWKPGVALGEGLALTVDFFRSRP